MARLTPIDALRYTEQTSGKRKNRATHGSKISKLAYANLGRNRILVGILNYFNAILTGIMTRRREFAMLQSVGMTWRQLKKMLILEGVYYAIGAGILSILIAMIISPLLGNLLETVFWFFSYRFVIWPVFAIIPVFLLLGIILPVVIYHFAERQTIVERLRETEYSAKRLLNLREKMLDFMITL